MVDRIWSEVLGDGPVVATAIHAGHDVRAELAPLYGLGEDERFREEDPFTDEWTVIAPTRIVATRSRFEVDLNRPRQRCVYLTPMDAWGLPVWRDPLPDPAVRRSRKEYRVFYARLEELLTGIERRHGRFVVLDLHSYNHRRAGPDGPPASPEENPQVNVGTGTVDRSLWGGLVDRFVRDLSAFPFPGGPLDVRENIKFRGGHMSRWIHEHFPQTGCALAIELKKFFMDEWTGVPDRATIAAITEALGATIPGLLEELART